MATCKTANRTHTCGELRIANVGEQVTLSGWVQQSRDMNHFAFVDVRDRFGITQVIFPKEGADAEGLKRYEAACKLGREFVIKATGKVVERSNKNKNRPTGEIEVVADALEVLNSSVTPPFKIEDATDAGEETRMRYRYLDIRRNPIKEALLLRNRVSRLVREYLNNQEFCEVETPVLIKSTPEGARDFVVPSRMNPGCFYALPQSPQTFKQLLMVAGMDRYFQIVKCFRDEELRADRQPEFTQIDCEMSFVSQDDVLNLFEGMIRSIFKEVVGHEFPKFERMEYSEAMDRFGIDKPDLRFNMELVDITDVSKGCNFQIFDQAEIVVGMCCKGLGDWSTKKIKDLEKKATGQEVGADSLVWLKYNKDGTFDCSAKKFFTETQYKAWVEKAKAKPDGCEPGDLLLILCGPKLKTQEQMGKFRHLMGTELGLRNKGYKALWVVNFPMLEWDEDEERFVAKHHPFTSPWEEDIQKMVSLDAKDQKLNDVRANAYDMVINGVEVGGGSIRIHHRELQEKVFDVLGFTKEEAKAQFGFLMGAFEHGAPPHGGLAFGLDRLCTILGGKTTIRDFIAFPKNNQGRDTMINAPSPIAEKQLVELSIATTAETIAFDPNPASPTADEPAKEEKQPKKKEKAEKPAKEEKKPAEKKEDKPAAKEEKKKGGKEAAAKELTPEDIEKMKKDQLKKVIKEGGKRGVEIEGAADMGGLQFFCTAVEFPDGDVDLLVESMNAMNKVCAPDEEERKGCSGHVGKMIFSAGTDQLAVVAYVPEDKQSVLSCKEWLEAVLASQKGEVKTSDKGICTGYVKANSEAGIFPLKIREPMILEANNFLRKKGLFPEDNDDSDEMVFGDDDFPSM
eukprot:TRINITY_DN3042_c0_g2_i1.p1 TRINITY_DN3042_c0_g2~~TRINITY_DN3042_c0_g2_i1.p1  ORF type:complete len:852 (+),score=329.27 TRINITY_DN3042_c0_g2_i1:84-2639(+)